MDKDLFYIEFYEFKADHREYYDGLELDGEPEFDEEIGHWVCAVNDAKAEKGERCSYTAVDYDGNIVIC